MTEPRALRLYSDQAGYRACLEPQPRPTPQPNEVLIEVDYSSVNYKDALAATGQAPVVKTFPLIGGIDAAGTVIESRHPDFQPGMAVIATGWGLGFDHDGGYAQWLCVPGEWLQPVPAGMETRTAMIYGTAGLTAALALERMFDNGQTPDLGPIVVTGASGGVGSLAVAMLSRLGFEVAAVSGKPACHDWLKTLGATQILGRDALPGGERPLERAVWGGAVDTVGGAVLARLTRTVVPNGNIAAIGLAGGAELNTTVMPFILRGVSLLGCDSVMIPNARRARLWQHLAADWRPENLDQLLSTTVTLDGLLEVFAPMLAGQQHGRILVAINQPM